MKVDYNFKFRIREIRDKNNELPDDADEIFRQLTLESIGFITLNCRLGLLNDNSNSQNSKILIKAR